MYVLVLKYISESEIGAQGISTVLKEQEPKIATVNSIHKVYEKCT